MTSDGNRRAEGFAFLAAFGLCIPAANWLIGNVGTTCVPGGGPCLIGMHQRDVVLAPFERLSSVEFSHE